MLPDPTIYRPQLDGSPFARVNCTAAAGAMALDAYTGGAIRPTPDAIRQRQDDQAGGISLDDLAQAWRSYGQRLTVDRPAWSAIVDRLRAGDGVVLQGDYDRVPDTLSSQPDFDGGHAVYVSRLSPADATAAIVWDPLALRERAWPLAVLRAYYSASTSFRAGWGEGVYRPPTAPTHRATVQGARLRSGPNLSAGIVRTVSLDAWARVEGEVGGSTYRIGGRRSDRWLRIVALGKPGRRLARPLYSAALLWRRP